MCIQMLFYSNRSGNAAVMMTNILCALMVALLKDLFLVFNRSKFKKRKYVYVESMCI